jgi:hypothetical protein
MLVAAEWLRSPQFHLSDEVDGFVRRSIHKLRKERAMTNCFQFPMPGQYPVSAQGLGRIEEGEIPLRCATFCRAFRIGAGPSFLPQMRRCEKKLNRIGTMLIAFDLAVLVPGSVSVWRPRRKLMNIMDTCFGLQNLSSAATRYGPRVIVRALSKIANVLEFVFAVRAALTCRKSRHIKVSHELEQLIVASVRRTSNF